MVVRKHHIYYLNLKKNEQKQKYYTGKWSFSKAEIGSGAPRLQKAHTPLILL